MQIRYSRPDKYVHDNGLQKEKKKKKKKKKKTSAWMFREVSAILVITDKIQ